MKLKVEILCTPKEFQELFTPGKDQTEFTKQMFAAYTTALQNAMQDAVTETFDPKNMFNMFKVDD